MRIALIVGINHYVHSTPLHGCVNDAHHVAAVLERHSDGTVNFDTKTLIGSGPREAVMRSDLRNHISKLFSAEADTALFFFAGHGHIESTGGYLIASDSEAGDQGIPLSDIFTFANKSPAKNKIIILDSCHSGIAGDRPNITNTAEIKEGVTILTASTAEQYATEENGAGIFTTLLVDALNGAAANLLGDVTPGSVYAHIDQSLGAWDQRPVFKTNVKSFISLRKTQPPLSLEDLRKIAQFFPKAGYQFDLDPTFEPERSTSDPSIPNPIPANTAKFAILQKLNHVNLVIPVDAPHMWHAAMNRKSCKLTVLGEHYRRLVEKGRL